MARLTLKSVVVILLWTTCLFTLYSIYPRSTYSGVARVDPNASDPMTVQRLSSKLEFVNNKLLEKDYELNRLQSQFQQAAVKKEQGQHTHAPKAVADGNATSILKLVPNLFQLMPHLEGDSNALRPHRTLGQYKPGAEMVLAVPHVHRKKEDYLIRTLKSIFTQMSKQERDTTVVIVVVAEPFNESVFEKVSLDITHQFPVELEQGALEIILPPAKWYPDLEHLPEKWGDKPTRAKWRTKQNLDYAFMMLYCSHIANLYVQLEDDISAKPQYIAQMKKYATSQDRWELLEFSQLGFIGKMFRSETLPKFVTFVLMFYKHKPVDWLLDNYFWVQECHGPVPQPQNKKSCSDLAKIRKRFRPSLFQHEGYHSSLDGKVQKLKDKDFNKKGSGSAANDPVIFAHRNPPATLSTSLKVYQKFNLAQCYEGKSVFWALNPQPNDYITINFNRPTALRGYKVVSGDRQHKDDRLANSSIEFMPDSPSAPRPKDSFLLDDSGFVGFRFFNISGKREPDDDVIYSVAEGSIPPNFGKVKAARIMSHTESQNWLIISELWFQT